MLIRETADGRWEIVDADGTVLSTVDTYDQGLAFIGGAITYDQAANGMPSGGDPTSSTLLDETWMSDQGICFSEMTADGRDFTQCAWTWRDPQMSLLPLMLQTETEVGHFGAVLAGFIQELHMVGATPQASGRYYATDAGRAARDLIADGRRFGVSVDATDVDVEFTCTEEDADGYCIDGVMTFNAYEIGGLTMTPFPAFANASIITAPATIVVAASGGQGGVLHVGAADGINASRDLIDAAARRVVAAATVVLDRPSAPARATFEIAEPVLGQPFALGSLGDEWLVDQGDGHLAMPLHIDPDGSRTVVGHLAFWGQCHTGYPGQCVTPPESATAYAHFHVGETVCADGTRLATGALVAGCDHALTRLRAREAQDHYAHNGIAWANVRISNGVYGPWVTGVLRADVTDDQIAVLRGGALSGDWRRLGNGLELVAALAVTTPGFPIAREVMVASGMPLAPVARLASRTAGGEIQSLVASGIVRRCPECARRGSQAAAMAPSGSGPRPGLGGAVEGRLARMEATLATLERRTRPLNAAAARHIADGLASGG